MNEKLLGKKIREVRKRWGLTQEELAERAGFSLQHVGDIERGKANPTLTCLLKLADVMGVTVADFFIVEEHKEPTETEMKQQLIAFIEKAARKDLLSFYALYKGMH